MWLQNVVCYSLPSTLQVSTLSCEIAPTKLCRALEMLPQARVRAVFWGNHGNRPGKHACCPRFHRTLQFEQVRMIRPWTLGRNPVLRLVTSSKQMMIFFFCDLEGLLVLYIWLGKRNQQPNSLYDSNKGDKSAKEATFGGQFGYRLQYCLVSARKILKALVVFSPRNNQVGWWYQERGKTIQTINLWCDIEPARDPWGRHCRVLL